MPRASGNISRYDDVLQETIAKDKTLILFNLELDTLRGDLGNLGFPPKEIHYSFLSKFLPVFYLRPRDYSKVCAELVLASRRMVVALALSSPLFLELILACSVLFCFLREREREGLRCNPLAWFVAFDNRP